MAEVFVQPGAIDSMLPSPPTGRIRQVHKMMVRKRALPRRHERVGETGVGWCREHATIAENGDKGVPFTLLFDLKTVPSLLWPTSIGSNIHLFGFAYSKSSGAIVRSFSGTQP